MVQKIVIDGGPGIGKTTILRGLEQAGFQIVEEAARFIIQERQKRNPSYRPTDDLLEFQKCVVNMQWNWEATAEAYAKVRNTDVVCDRGMVSTIAYLRYGNIEVPQGYIDEVRGKYDKVLIPDLLSNYNTDDQRFEDSGDAQRIHELHIQAYLETGYTPIRVPVFPTPEERIQFVIENIRQ